MVRLASRLAFAHIRRGAFAEACVDPDLRRDDGVNVALRLPIVLFARLRQDRAFVFALRLPTLLFARLRQDATALVSGASDAHKHPRYSAAFVLFPFGDARLVRSSFK